MKKKAKGPVLNPLIISGNSNNGNHETPLSDASEADKQDDINAIVNEYADFAQFRRRLKDPKLEVVVDGTIMSTPFAATSSRRFQLSPFARFVQVFATQNGLRNIVSSLSLPCTEISGGKSWHSELELEGKQVVKLIVEPAMDDDGKLASSSLLVGYQPKRAIGATFAVWVKDFWERSVYSRPAWTSMPFYAAILGVLALVPFFTIGIFSKSALFVLITLLTALLLVVSKINPNLGLVGPHQIAVDSFVALMLVAMLFLGILPPGRISEAPVGAARNSLSPRHASPYPPIAALGIPPELHVVTADQTDLTNYVWSAYGSRMIGSQFSLNVWGANYDPTQDYLLVRPRQEWGENGWQLTFINAGVHSQRKALSSIAVRSIAERPQSETLSPVTAESKKNESPTERAHGVGRKIVGSTALRETFRVEVLVDASEILKLINPGTTHLEVAHSYEANQTIWSSSWPDNRAVAESNSKAEQVRSGEVLEAHNPVNTPTTAFATAPAWVVFESPTQLGSLNKGDVVNANFKPTSPATGYSGGLSVCAAVGVVQEKRMNGTDVEVRVGLKLSLVHNGKPVYGSLDLLLTDCTPEKQNSHHGFLEVAQQVTEVGPIAPGPRRP